MILQQPFAWPFGWLSQTGIGYRRIEERKGKKEGRQPLEVLLVGYRSKIEYTRYTAGYILKREQKTQKEHTIYVRHLKILCTKRSKIYFCTIL